MSQDKQLSHQIFDDKGILDIHQHCFYGNIAAIKHYIENTGCVNERTIEKRRTPLHFASAGGQKDICEYLINNNALVNSKDIEGITPIFYAAFQNDFQLLTLLFGSRASLTVRSDQHLNLYHAACSVDTPELFNFLKYLSAYKALANQPTRDGNTPLFFACKQGNLIAVKTLLNDFGIKNLKQKNQHGYTLLHVASKFGHLSLVQFLLKLGIDPRTKTLNSETALTLANECESYNTNSIVRLITRTLKSWPVVDDNSMEIEENNCSLMNTFQTEAKRKKS